MVESFKIRAEHLKRYLKISVNLPREYNNNESSYPLVLVFDGQLFYNFLNEETRVIEMEKIIDSINKDFICITLHINNWSDGSILTQTKERSKDRYGYF